MRNYYKLVQFLNYLPGLYQFVVQFMIQPSWCLSLSHNLPEPITWGRNGHPTGEAIQCLDSLKEKYILNQLSFLNPRKMNVSLPLCVRVWERAVAETRHSGFQRHRKRIYLSNTLIKYSLFEQACCFHLVGKGDKWNQECQGRQPGQCALPMWVVLRIRPD